MPAAPTGAEIVGPVADDRIDERVDEQRDRHRETDEPRIDADHLAVEEQQEIAEAVVLDPKCDRAEAVGELGPQGGRGRRRTGGRRRNIGQNRASLVGLRAQSARRFTRT